MRAISSTAAIYEREWDFVVLGGGTAGLVAAQTAAEFGAHSLLIDPRSPGGDCLWTGCVPSKAMIAVARAALPPAAGEMGIRRDGVVDFSAVMGHVRESIARIEPHDSVETLMRAGVVTLNGRARFLDGRSLTVSEGSGDGGGDRAGQAAGDRKIRFRQAMIASGASAAVPAPFASDSFTPLTTETVWELDELPGRLLVVGGGPVGCELSQAFARLGAEVTLVQRDDRLIPRECVAAEQVVAGSLAADGVDIRRGRTVVAVASDSGRSGSATLNDGSTVEFDRMLLAVGKTPNTAALGLAAAGVGTDASGSVVVADTLRTSVPRIWAAGDVTGLPHFTHTAGVNGSIAAANAVLGLSRTIDRRVIPRVTFTHPEVASVGIPESEVSASGHRVVTIQHCDLDRAICESETAGFTRIITDRKGVLLGGTIVGPRAGESLAEVTLAVKRSVTASQLSGTTHPYPTYNDAVWDACVQVARDQLGSGMLGAATRVLARIRRVRMR